MFKDVRESCIVSGRCPEGNGKNFIVIIIHKLQEACPGNVVGKN